MPQPCQSTKADFFLKILAVITLAFLPFACMDSLDRQVEVDYQKCLSWQADGYDVQCRPIKE